LAKSKNKYKNWSKGIHKKLSTNNFRFINPKTLKVDPKILTKVNFFIANKNKVLSGAKLTSQDLDLTVEDSTEIFMNNVTFYQRDINCKEFGQCHQPLDPDSLEDNESKWYSDIRLSDYPVVTDRY
jgi:hypothetical protein